MRVVFFAGFSSPSPSTSVAFADVAFFFAALLRAGLGGGASASRSTFSAVSTAVATPPSAEPNHSRIVWARPTVTGDMWLVMSGISSAWHFATMSLDATPISLASWWIRSWAFLDKGCSCR
ncbi:MAG: hypothetical protein ACO3YY_08365 [Phycisphaerales bacterium]